MGASNSKQVDSTPTSSTTTSTPTTTDEKPKCKPCCVCKDTREARDKCMIENEEEACRDLILAHQECMRKNGFKV